MRCRSCRSCSLLLLLLAVLCHRPAAASRVYSKDPPLDGPPLVGQDVTELYDRLLGEGQPQQPGGGGLAAAADTWTSSSKGGHARRLLAETALQVTNSNMTAICPSSVTGNWTAIPGYGHLVSDNWLCENRPTQLHGAAAQSFTDRPNWSTYGWAAFEIPPAQAGMPLSAVPKARLEGLNLLLLGNQGLGGSGNCSISAVEYTIYTDSGGAPGTKVVGNTLQLGTSGKTNSWTFGWWGNYSSVLHMDIVDKSAVNTSSNPPAVEVDYATKYWLRIQVLAAYGASTKCFVHWALNSANKAGYNALWQEAVGGAAGYSTLCTGAGTSSTLPGPTQTLYSCFNGGRPNTGSIRRCATYKNTVANPITCPAQFRDFAFSFYGHNAVSCPDKPALALANGDWPNSCAGKKVDEVCNANCTWGPTPGSASTVCLVTGQWSTTITGTCEVPPTQCATGPANALTVGTDSWGACAGTPIDSNCTATCTWGPIDATRPTAVCRSVPYGYPNITAWEVTGACYPAPTNCTTVPTLPVTEGAWQGSCAGTLVGSSSCTATCNWGASASGTPTATCVSVPNNYPQTTNWTATGDCNPYPTKCPTEPYAALTDYGTWPTCANRLIGDNCTATCPGGGTATVTCQTVPGQPDGNWTATVTGRCNVVKCFGEPTASLTNFGTWNGTCSGQAVGTTCAAGCPGGGSATVTCQAPSGNWSSTTSGSCSPVTCSGQPTATVANGTWSCATTAGGATCSATCISGGTATVECVGATASWSNTVSGACNPITCSGTPPTVGNGSWPSCGGAYQGDTCTANCATNYAGTVTSVCGSNGQWGTVSGTCERVNCTGNPTSVSNGTWTNCPGTYAGDNCTATCNFNSNDGYYTGTVTAACLASGNWDTVSGTCEPVTCAGNPTASVSNGTWPTPTTCDGTLAGSVCTANCDTNYAGNVLADCMSNGQWNGTVSGTCEP